MKGDRLTLGLLIGFVSLLGWSQGAIAQLIPDQTLGSNPSIVTPLSATIDRIDGGATRGINLFHSFQEFNIGEGRAAYFILQDAALKNVFARVTGSNRSEILGRLGAAGSDANLFLINPNGILFGPSSSLDVGGSFAITTANAIEFGDRGNFSATNPMNPSPLLTVDASAFLFTAIDRQAGMINQSSARGTTSRGNRFVGLKVLDGQSLVFLGGDVKMEGGIAQAPGGRVELGGLAEVGRVGLAVNGSELQLQFPDGVARSDVSLADSPLIFSGVNVLAGGGGNIVINARNLDILDSSFLQAGIGSGLGSNSSQAGNIIINATNVFQLNGIGVINIVEDGAIGNAGDLIVNSGTLNVTNGAGLTSATSGQGDAGNVSITVRDVATFKGVDNDGFSSNAGSTVSSSGLGKGGKLTLNAGTLNVSNGAILTSSTSGQGDAGDVSITVRDVATFDGVGIDGSSSGVGSQVNAGAVGKGGTLTFNVGALNVTNGAVLTSSTFGQGDAGDVSIAVRGAANFNGIGSNGASSGGGSQVNAGAVGKGGTFTFNTDTLTVTHGAALTSSTFGQGDAGNVLITVRGAAIFDGEGRNGSLSSAGSQVAPGAVGRGGTLSLNATSLNVTNGAQLTSSTFGRGDAGNVLITVRDTANFEGMSRNGVSTSAGSIVGFNAVGKGGTLTLNAGNLNVSKARLNSSAFGQGDAGDIILRVRDTLRVIDGSIATISLLNTSGKIDIAANTIRLLGDTNILTFVFSGAGGGGSITLSANSIVALNDSDILAFARDGKGGNVTLNTRAFFGQNYRTAPPGTDPITLDGNDRVDINASGTISGIITLPDVSFIQNGLTQLPKSAIDTDKLISQTCIVRKGKPQGTFYILGKTNLPQRPGDPTPSNYSTQETTTQTANKPWQKGDPIVEPTGFYKLANGRLVMSRECDR